MLKYCNNLENIELYFLILLLFTIWFIYNTIQYYRAEKRKIKYLHHFAKEGELDAQNELAQRYHKGDMLKKDCDKAAFWYQKAAFNGDKIAKGKFRVFLNQRKKKKKC